MIKDSFEEKFHKAVKILKEVDRKVKISDYQLNMKIAYFLMQYDNEFKPEENENR